jgi:hypothetical protein
VARARFHLIPPHAALGGHLPPSLPAWRLIGGNNRVLGLSPKGYEDFETGYAAVLFLRERIADAVPVLGFDAVGGRTWRLEIDGLEVARSGRAYLRGRENLYNLVHFTESVPLAELPAKAGQSGQARRSALSA